MEVIIDDNSGFCFGVVRAIGEAESALERVGDVYSLGDIVHNRVEVQRLEQLGLHTISHEDMPRLEGRTLLIRAHGEPPRTYRMAEELGITVIDATCPVVARLQRRLREAYDKMQEVGGSVVLLGKRGHAEVIGLTGQADDDVVVVENEADLNNV
ncbi:MAG: 4-hydroxy-3-methylbut-2-enyl diphosphate reductase, partial [Alistipes sp.]|nr:4-hydroxy-3-methylbut-2-enyl diphosphate reductase [Alistipes sp.]